MATLVPLNTFKSVASNLTTINTLLYVAPTEITTIVLMAQIANVGNATANATFYYKTNTGPMVELVKDFEIPKADAGSVLTGKLVLEQADKIYAVASANNRLKIVLSLLETSNQ
jgi:hypothetical protein